MSKTLLAVALLGACASLGLADMGNELLPGRILTAGGKPIDFKVGHLVPSMADFNGDGKKDLLIGHFSDPVGNVVLFLNVGTDADPKFDEGKMVEAAGKPIRLDGG